MQGLMQSRVMQQWLDVLVAQDLEVARGRADDRPLLANGASVPWMSCQYAKPAGSTTPSWGTNHQ